jgi:hypothetical protein
MSTHAPPVLDDSCNYPGKTLKYTRDNIKQQLRCGLEDMERLFDKLTSLQIYDSALIVINADHGAGDAKANRVKMRNEDKLGDMGALAGDGFHRIVASALPLIMIKPPYASGPLVISRAPVSLADIPDTIAGTLGFDAHFGGRDMFTVGEDEDRERTFRYYKWRHRNWQADYFQHIDEFTVSGDPLDATSWELVGSLFPPGESLAVEKSREIDFGTPAADRFKLAGWGRDKIGKSDETFTVALGGSASIQVPIPRDTAMVLTATVSTPRFDSPQRIKVVVDGAEVGSWECGAPWVYSTHQVILLPDPGRPERSRIDFVFTHHLSEEGKRPIAARFDSVVLSRATGDG